MDRAIYIYSAVLGLILGIVIASLSWATLPRPKCDNEIVNHVEITQEPDQIGLASWYDYDLRTKNQKCRADDCYSKSNITCASRDYPRGSILEVKHLDKVIHCRVNDYGPEEKTGKIIDLSSYAFSQLAPLKTGIIDVEIINLTK